MATCIHLLVRQNFRSSLDTNPVHFFPLLCHHGFDFHLNSRYACLGYSPLSTSFSDFVTDLTPDARVLYSSDSIVDVLGWTPDEVVNRSCWEFFCEDELPFAKAFHKKGVQMDKAAVLSYCRVKNKEGQWTGVECCFTVVYDVMIVCTSIYRRGLPSQSKSPSAFREQPSS